MLVFLGLKVGQPVSNKQRYKEALQEIRHYLSFKAKIVLEQTDYVLTIINEQYSFSFVKNPLFLHTNFYNMPILNQQDFEYMDICYQCLMIIRENFPSSINIQLITDSQSKELQFFQERKEEEFNRRLNSSLKNLIDSKELYSSQEIQDIIFMIIHHYTKKNKIVALKMLMNRVTVDNAYGLAMEYVQYLQQLQSEADLKKLVSQLIDKIRHIKSSQSGQSENMMRESNMSVQKYAQNIKIQPLIFQLKESYQLQRICSLLSGVLSVQQEKEYYAKLQASVKIITDKFLGNELQGAERLAGQFNDILKRFWAKRGKRWQQTVRQGVQSKCRQMNSSRMNVNKSKVKLLTSRKMNNSQ